MKIEHIAFNVTDPPAVAAWYCGQFGLRVLRHIPQPSQTHFLADSEATVFEIYTPPENVPDYRSMHQFLFHLAFTSCDAIGDTRRIIECGAELVEEILQPDGPAS